MQIKKIILVKMGNPKGFGLIETLVSITITMIGLVGVGTFLIYQNKEIMRHSQKYEVVEIRNNLYSALLDSSACKTILNNMNDSFSEGAVINLTQISVPKYGLNLKKPSAQSEPILNSSSGLKLKSLTFNVNSLVSNTTDQYLGYFEVQIESNDQSFKPIKTSKIVKVNSLGKAESCVAELTLSCPAGEFYSGIDSSGLPICISLDCPTGKAAQGVSPTGVVICVDDTAITQKVLACASSEYISGVNASGNAICLRLPAANSTPTSPPPPNPVCVLDFISDQNDGWDFPGSIPVGSADVSGTKTQRGCIPTTSVCIGTTLTFSFDMIQGQRHFFVANTIKGVSGRSGNVVYRCP